MAQFLCSHRRLLTKLTTMIKSYAKAENFYSEKNILAVDSNFLQTFNNPLLQGDAGACLEKPNSVVSCRRIRYGDCIDSGLLAVTASQNPLSCRSISI